MRTGRLLAAVLLTAALFTGCRKDGAREAPAAPDRANASRSREELAKRAAKRLARSILALDPRKDASGQPRKWREFSAAFEAVKTLGPEIVPHLCKLAKHKNRRVRFWVVGSIPFVTSGAEMAIPTLVGALQDPDPLVRFEGAGGLGQIGPAGRVAYSRLLLALYDEDQQVRAAAGYSLAALAPRQQDLPGLIAALGHKDPVARTSAARALAAAGTRARSALPALEKAAGDKNKGVRNAAFRAIGRIKGLPIGPWRWSAQKSTPFWSVACYKGPYDLEIVKKGGGKLVSRVRRKGKILYEWPVYSHGTPFIIDGDVLYRPWFGRGSSGCVLIAFDLKQGKKLWETRLEGVGPVAHSKYSNYGINMILDKGILRIDGSEAGGKYTEFVDAATGKALANYR